MTVLEIYNASYGWWAHDLRAIYLINLTGQKQYVTELKWIWPLIMSRDSPEIILSLGLILRIQLQVQFWLLATSSFFQPSGQRCWGTCQTNSFTKTRLERNAGFTWWYCRWGSWAAYRLSSVSSKTSSLKKINL